MYLDHCETLVHIWNAEAMSEQRTGFLRGRWVGQRVSRGCYADGLTPGSVSNHTNIMAVRKTSILVCWFGFNILTNQQELFLYIYIFLKVSLSTNEQRISLIVGDVGIRLIVGDVGIRTRDHCPRSLVSYQWATTSPTMSQHIFYIISTDVS